MRTNHVTRGKEGTPQQMLYRVKEEHDGLKRYKA